MKPWILGVALFGLGVAHADTGLQHLSVSAADQTLAVWSRQPLQPRGIVVLVHGRTWSARTAFDFDTPNARDGNRSLLKSFAAAGFAVYAVDLPGYGATPPPTEGWLAPHIAARDVDAVVRFAAQRHPGLPAPILLGWSRGSRISALLASHAHEPLSALILYAYAQDPAAPPVYGPAQGARPHITNTSEAARSDFISPDVTSAAMIQDFVDQALRVDPMQANVCCDAEFLDIHPEAIQVPTLLIQGARDPAIKPAVAEAFFSHLGSADRRWIIVGRGDHAAHLEDTAPEVIAAMLDFMRAQLPNGSSMKAKGSSG